MDIKRIKLTKRDLQALLPEERLFLLHILNIANDINSLQKITMFSIKGIVTGGPNDGLANQAQNIQSISLIGMK